MKAALIAGAVAAFALYLTGLPLAVGAHPFWAVKVIWIGAPLGLLVSLAFIRLPRTSGIALSGAVLIASYLVAHIGKTRFAASYAEDALAGQMWYFGWIATCAAIVLAVATIAGAVARKS